MRSTTPAQIEEAKTFGIQLNRRKWCWKIVSQSEDEKEFFFGARHFTTAEKALHQAIADANLLKQCSDHVEPWKKTQCKEYLASHKVSGCSRGNLDDLRAKVAGHLWTGPRKNLPFTLQEADPSKKEVKDASPQESAHGTSKTPKAQESKLDGLPVQDVSSSQVEDVTQQIFRRKSEDIEESQGEQQIVAKKKKASCESSAHSESLLPKITIVKFLEAVELEKSNPNAVTVGELLALKLNKGRHQGKWHVISLFVGASNLSADDNMKERKEWLAQKSEGQVTGRRAPSQIEGSSVPS